MPNVKTCTGLVRIIALPDGPWPRWVRLAWVGLQFPCEPTLQRNENRNGRLEVIVPQDKAIEILEKSSPLAAQFWKDQGLPEADAYFGFGVGEIEILNESVSYPQVLEVPDEAQGQLSR